MCVLSYYYGHESPHTDYYKRDFSEMIDLYNHLIKTYDALLHDIRDLRFRLDGYIRTTDKTIADKVDARVKIYEQAVLKYRRECENNYNAMRSMLDSYEKRYSRRIDRLEKHIHKWHRHLNAHEQKFYKLLNSYQKELQEISKNWTKEFAEFTERVDIRMDAWRLFARGLDYQNRQWTEGLVKTLEDTINDIVTNNDNIVFNPYRYSYGSLQTYINDMWNFIFPVPWGYTAEEWDKDKEITCEIWDRHRHMTCIDWYIKGKLVFHFKERHERINSWISGRKVYWREAIHEIYPLLFKLLGAIKAGEYDGWEVTAEEYDELEATARQYDFGIIREKIDGSTVEPDEGE